MATIIKPDGTQQEYQPKNGRDFQLKELQAIVGGDIEVIPTRDGRIMVINEEGKLEDLERNDSATSLIDFPDPGEIKAMIRKNPEVIFVGDLEETDYIVGTVLVCEDREVR